MITTQLGLSRLFMAVCLSCALASVRPASAETVTFQPGPDVQEKVQEAFILSPAGTTFVFAEGRYTFDQSTIYSVHVSLLELMLQLVLRFLMFCKNHQS